MEHDARSRADGSPRGRRMAPGRHAPGHARLDTAPLVCFGLFRLVSGTAVGPPLVPRPDWVCSADT